MPTKKNVLSGSIVLSLPILYLFTLQMYEYKDIFLGLFIFSIVFLFSLITYFLSESVFRAWVNFMKWWVPLQIFLVLITPESSGGYFVSIIDKQFVAIIMSSLFAILSSLIIIWKSFTKK